MTAERLSELLHETTPEPPGHIDPNAVLRQAGRRRTTRTAGIAVVAVTCVLAGGFGLAPLLGADSGDEHQVVVPPPEIAEHNGVRFTLPDDWKIVEPQSLDCNVPKDRTVVVGEPETDHCKEISDPLQRAVRMADLYGTVRHAPAGFEGEQGWKDQPGLRPGLVREGQPAWLQSARVPAPEGVRGWYASLTLPWLNTVVYSYGPSRAVAEGLLDRVEIPEPPDTLTVPSDAKWIGGVGTDLGDDTLVTTEPEDVQRVLDALGRLTPSTELTEACTDPAEWKPGGVQLRVTVESGEQLSYFVRNDRCAVVTGPEGGVFSISPELGNILQE